MRIAIFTNNYLPNPYGVPNSIESFRKEFESLGHKVFIFAPKWKGYVGENSNVFWFPAVDIRYKINFPLPIPYSGKINKILENLDIDIIHSQHSNLLGSAAMKWAKKKNIPLVFTWHTLYDQYAHFAPLIPERLAAWWTIRNAKNYANRCDAVVTPTPFVEEIIKGWGVKNKNIIAIPTGVEEPIFASPDRNSIRKKYGIKEDEVVLLSVGRFTAEKNMEFLFKSVAEILKKNKGVKFLVGGEGYLEEKLEKIVLESGTKSRVIFAGFVDNKIKKNFYLAGDIFVYASKSETQGMILTEAMYSGLPIVAVRAPGARDIVLDGETGFLVPENNKEFVGAVQKLIEDKELRLKFSEEAKKIAREKYTSQVCAEKMLKVYEKAIKEKNNQ
ncbi:MAG: glycosyltransferase [Patescibacteria group bacterium]